MTGLAGAVAAAISSGVLHALALGPAPRHLLAWLALVPLLRAVARASRPSHVIAASIAYALTVLVIDVAPWFVPTIGRYFAMGPAAAWTLGTLAVAVTGVTYGALLGLALASRRRIAPTLGVVWCAALWSLWEPLRTAILPPYFPLSFLAASQIPVAPVLQLASVTGIAGVSALVVGVNAAIAQLWSGAVPRRRARVSLGLASAGAIAVALWGAARLADAPALAPDGAPTVVLVDGAATHAAESTLERYITASAPARGARPAFVVWPESALTEDLMADPRSWTRLRRFVDDLGAPLVTGGVGSTVAPDGHVLRFNSVHFIRPRHGLRSYHKRILVPVAESWPSALGPPPAVLDPVSAGRELVIFEAGDTRVGPLVCFEIMDAASARRLARRGAQVLVNVNNDVWFGGAAPHTRWAQVRAVEAGVPVVRASNGGVSAVIDGFGRQLVSSRAAGRPAVLTGAIPEPVVTLYVRTGEVFLPVCALVVAAGLLPRRRLTARPYTAASRCRG